MSNVFSSWLNFITSSDTSHEKQSVDVCQMEQESPTSSAAVKDYQQLPSKRRVEQPLGTHGKYVTSDIQGMMWGEPDLAWT